MKKLLSIISLAFLVGIASITSAGAASYIYKLDVNITNPGSITEDENKIAGVEFDVFGGILDQDWTLVIGDAVPMDQGNWLHQGFDTLNGVYDDYDWENPEYAPMVSGTVLTIFSDVELTFSEAYFFDYTGALVSNNYFEATGFVEQDPVPIPGGIILLGAGLAGLFGMARRKRQG